MLRVYAMVVTMAFREACWIMPAVHCFCVIIRVDTGLSPYVSEAICAVMLLHFGKYLCSYDPTFRGYQCYYAPKFRSMRCLYAATFRRLFVLLCSDVSDAVCAIMLRRFGGYLCSYAPTFRRLLCSDVSETICAYMLRNFGDCAIILRRFGG